jgi:hypothetical protein
MSSAASKCWRNCDSLVVSVMDSAGGLAIQWYPTKARMEHLLSSPNFLTVGYRLIHSQASGHLTNVYGPMNALSKGHPPGQCSGYQEPHGGSTMD